jgi:hypothetical protein
MVQIKTRSNIPPQQQISAGHFYRPKRATDKLYLQGSLLHEQIQRKERVRFVRYHAKRKQIAH